MNKNQLSANNKFSTTHVRRLYKCGYSNGKTGKYLEWIMPLMLKAEKSEV